MVLIPENNPTELKGQTLTINAIDKLRSITGVNPLSNHKFYLDIKNYTLSTKIELKIKQLGGDVSLFLTDEVTHIITDSITTDACSSSNLQGTLSSSFHSSIYTLESSVSPSVSKQSVATGTKRQSCPRSRADAMLERAQCNLDSCHSPLQVARTRDIPVWNVDKILQHLNKISAAPIFDSDTDVKTGCTKLLTQHLKVESIKGDFRPAYKYFHSWPVLNLIGELGTCPFKKAQNPSEESMVRRSAFLDSVNDNSSDSQQRADNNTHQTSIAYCMELKKMARKTRQRTRHKETQNLQCGYCEICHIEYPDLSSHLQSTIHQNYVSQKSNFLSLDKLIHSDANVDTFLKTNKRCLRSQDVGSLKTSYDESSNQSEMHCETNKCTDHNKRCLRSFFKPQDVTSKHSYDSFDNTESNASLNSEMNSEDNGSYKRCLRSQDVPAAKSSNEVNLNHGESFRKGADKIISPDVYNRLRSRVSTHMSDSNIEASCNSLKSKPMKSVSSNSNDQLSRKNNLRQVLPLSPSYKIVGSKSKVKEQEKFDKKSSGLVVKFKRIRQSELLVLSDEAEHFMFPKRDDTSSDSESEQEDHKVDSKPSNRTSIVNVSDSDSDTSEDNLKLSEIRNKQRFPLNPTQPVTSVGDRVGLTNDLSAEDVDKFKFAFEYSNTDLWCHTYKRKHQNKELKFISSIIGITNKRFKLPYEMGVLPPLTPNCCSLNIWPGAPIPEKKVRRRKRQVSVVNGKSRKSPREHASTLASMVQQRKKEELNALAIIKEESCSTEISDNSETIQQLDVMLSGFSDSNFADMEDVLEEGVSFNIRYEPSVVNLIETIDQSGVLEEVSVPTIDDHENPCTISNGVEEPAEKDVDPEDINKLTFSFECTPNELWYHTYKRKDENKELKFLNARMKNGARRYKLPYELGPLPPLKPNCCELNTTNGNSSIIKRKLKRKKKLLFTNKKCRKSTREQALLAGFVNMHSKRDMLADSSSDVANINNIPESNTNHLDAMLSGIYNDKSCFDVKDILDEGVSLNVRYEPTVNNLLETLEESTVLENLQLQNHVNKQDRRKKRKNNKTGWPKRKKFLSRTTPSATKIQKEIFVNAATQTNSCALTNNEIVLSIPVTDSSVNIVELSSEPLVVCGDHSCSSGKENILCENSDLFVECMMKNTNSINSDNDQNKPENTSNDEQQNNSHIDINKVINLNKCGVNKINAVSNICSVDEASVMSGDKRFQPYVCVHKMDDPHNTNIFIQPEAKKKKINKTAHSICTISPRKLRTPRGKWYRER